MLKDSIILFAHRTAVKKKYKAALTRRLKKI
jgi:hypothetical protein